MEKFIEELNKSDVSLVCGIRSNIWTKKGEISIQASEFHYCIPKKNLKLEEYSNFEVALFDDWEKILKGFRGRAELKNFTEGYLKNGNKKNGIIFAYVPKKIVEKLYLYMNE